MQQWALYQKTYVRFIFACDINLPLKHCCATINISVPFKVTCSSVKHTECTITFPMPRELHIAPQSYDLFAFTIFIQIPRDAGLPLRKNDILIIPLT
jgi:hypothetical protein